MCHCEIVLGPCFFDFLLFLCFNDDDAAGFMLPQSLGLCVCVLCACVCVRLY